MAEQQIVLNPDLPPTNHGNTVAAWTLVAIMTVGVIVGTVGFDMAHTPILIVGVGIIILGAIAGVVLKAMGYGQGGSKTKSHH